MIKFDFSSIPIPLSGKVVEYICPKCKVEFEAPLEAVLEFEQDDEWNGLPISTPPYTIRPKCNHNKCVPYLKEDFITYIKGKNLIILPKTGYNNPAF